MDDFDNVSTGSGSGWTSFYYAYFSYRNISAELRIEYLKLGDMGRLDYVFSKNFNYEIVDNLFSYK